MWIEFNESYCEWWVMGDRDAAPLHAADTYAAAELWIAEQATGRAEYLEDR